jgi:ribonuclease H2 subunit A
MMSSSKHPMSSSNHPCRTFVRIPPACCGVDIVIGIDEAGRGPVLGPLIYAAAFWPVSEDENIKRMCDFDDSKKLKEGEREKLLDQILEHPSIGWVIDELTAEKISEDMLRAHPISLNTISYDAVIRILATIRDPPKEENPPQVTDVFIDTVGDPEFYKSRLVNALGKDYGKFTIEKKADATYKVVSAASIVAKVTRDALLRNWQWKEPTVQLDTKFGSGYPSDPSCVRWLENAQHKVFGFPNIVRFSWSTSRDLLEDNSKGVNCCSVKWECEEENEGTEDIKSFFAAKGVKKRQLRSPYFTVKKMKHVYIEDLHSI